ncbi:MAG: penicillin-binding protein 1A [Methyloligellaceae bacterium]
MSAKRSRTPARGRGRKPAGQRSRLARFLGYGESAGRSARPRRQPARKRRARGGSGRGRRSGTRGGFWRLSGRIAYWGFVCAIWASLIIGGVSAYFISSLPDPQLAGLEKRPPNVTILAADGTVMAERGLRRGHIRLKHLPPHLVNAVIATEDRRFYSHFGVDPVGLFRATVKNLRAGHVVEGGSTITQQLAKNLFLTSERTLARKLQEMVLAVWLESKFSKEKILELYLNRVYFGAGTYGVESAARRYFGKSARHVSVAEAALLAGLLKAPSRYAPTKSPRRAEERASVVLSAMVDSGMLKPNEAMTALAQPARVRNPSGLTGYEYAVDWVADLLPDIVADRKSDLIVETTIDPRLQRAAQKNVMLAMASEGGFVGAEQAAAVVFDPRGAVKAIVGGTSYKASQFNRAVKSLRQPGSAFKPIVFLAALEAGLTPDTIIEDRPVSINGWQPRNYDGTYAGRVTLRDALARSINTVAVRLTMEVGRWRVIRTARRLGISAPLHDRPSIALGTAEVTLLELTSAYVPFANGGEGIFPHVIKRVRTEAGKVLFDHGEQGPGRVVALPYVGAMNAMMSEVVTRGTGKAAALPGHPAAGKTGTSQSFRDAWFIGYTGHYVAGIWVGNDRGEAMKRVTGGGLPARIWHQIMREAHAGKRPVPLPGTYQPALAESLGPAGQQVSDQPVTPPAHIREPFLRRVFGAFRPNS